MSIESKIQQILAESQKKSLGEEVEIDDPLNQPSLEPNNARNNVDRQYLPDVEKDENEHTENAAPAEPSNIKPMAIKESTTYHMNSVWNSTGHKKTADQHFSGLTNDDKSDAISVKLRSPLKLQAADIHNNGNDDGTPEPKSFYYHDDYLDRGDRGFDKRDIEVPAYQHVVVKTSDYSNEDDDDGNAMASVIGHHPIHGFFKAKIDNDTAKAIINANPIAFDPNIHKVSNISGTSFKEDVDALVSGEELTEEFKQKAATIFEAAVLTRVKQEVARLDEAYQVQLDERVEEIKEGLVEKVDGYLDYVVEQWMKDNEIALESGMKSEILEGFVSGLKGLFEQHYIEVPEEKFDVLGSMQEQIAGLTTKLDEQVETNIELRNKLAYAQAEAVVRDLAEGLTDTDKDKFFTLVEELEFDGLGSFTKKAQTIRESYFTKKAPIQKAKSYVVTDEPVVLAEETKRKQQVDPQMANYLNVLNNLIK